MSDSKTTPGEITEQEFHRRNFAIMKSCFQEEREQADRYESAIRQIAHILSDLSLKHLAIVDTSND